MTEVRIEEGSVRFSKLVNIFLWDFPEVNAKYYRRVNIKQLMLDVQKRYRYQDRHRKYGLLRVNTLLLHVATRNMYKELVWLYSRLSSGEVGCIFCFPRPDTTCHLCPLAYTFPFVHLCSYKRPYWIFQIAKTVCLWQFFSDLHLTFNLLNSSYFTTWKHVHM